MIRYQAGDAARPEARPVVIAHVVNDAGLWGAGFTSSLSAAWPQALFSYRRWGTVRAQAGHAPYALGEIAVCPLADGVEVAHLCAQRGVRARGLPAPIRYDALETCLRTLAQALRGYPATPSLVMPRIGCGLASGTWDRVEPLVARWLGDYAPIVYDWRGR